MSWLRFNMSQSKYIDNGCIKPKLQLTTSNKPLLKTKPTTKIVQPTINVNSSFCYIEQQIKENIQQIVKDLHTKYKLQNMFITYIKKKRSTKV